MDQPLSTPIASCSGLNLARFVVPIVQVFVDVIVGNAFIILTSDSTVNFLQYDIAQFVSVVIFGLILPITKFCNELQSAKQ